MSAKAKERLTQWAVYLVLLACFFLYFQEFKGRPYRQDETLAAGWAEEGSLLDVSELIIYTSAQPVWFVVFDLWIDLFGSYETLGRASAHLIMMIVLAVIYRIGKKVSNAQVGFYSVVLLGTWPIFLAYGNELRHYAMLYLGCSLSIFGTLHWLRSPSPQRTLLVILGGSLAMLSHLYGYYLVVSLGITALLLSPHRNRHFWLGFFTIVISLGLIACIWLVPNLYVFLFLSSDPAFQSIQGDVRDVAVWQATLDGLALNPPSMTLFLTIPGLFVGFRQSPQTQGWNRTKSKYLPVSLLVVITLILALNLFVIKQFHYRYLAIVVILLAPIAATVIVRLEQTMRIVLIIILLAGMLSDERIFNGTGPYLEMVEFINTYSTPQSAYISDAIVSWEHWPAYYYLKFRQIRSIENHQIYFVTHGPSDQKPPLDLNALPINSINLITSKNPWLDKAIINSIGETEQVWRIIGAYGAASEKWLIPFRQRYALHRQHHWEAYEGMNALTVEEYRRIPDDLRPIAQANELTLTHWQLDLQSDARPCQTIHLNSWWQASRRPRANYSLSLVLVGQDGQGISQHGGGLSPTLSRLWKPGAPYLDERALFIPCDLPAGTYPLVFALYDSETLLNLDFATPSGDPIGRNLFLTQVTVSVP